MLKVVYPQEKFGGKFVNPKTVCFFKRRKYKIFLAGPCPRANYDEDWRYEAIDYFREANFDGIIFSPTNRHYDRNDPLALDKQTEWEQTAMAKADLVLFWIPRTEKDPAFTTNIELGHYLEKGRTKQFIIGMPDWGIKNDYIKRRLKMIGKEYDNDLRTLVNHAAKNHVVEKVNKEL